MIPIISQETDSAFEHKSIDERAIATERPTQSLPKTKSRVTSLQDLPLLLSVKDAATALGTGRNATYSLIRSGQLKSIRVGRLIKIPKTAIEEFLQNY